MQLSVRCLTQSVLVLVGTSFLPLVLEAGSRTWTDDTGGYKIEAELVDYADGNVRLRKTDGRIVSVPLSRLSAADRKFVNDLPASSLGNTPPERPAPRVEGSTSGSKDALIELLSGAKTEGRITARDDKYITVQIAIGARTFTRKYSVARIHAVTVGGKREVLNRMTASTGYRAPSRPSAGGGRTPSPRNTTRIDALIEKVGSTPPDWWDSVPLEYPQTLDLAWPTPPPPPWNAQRNISQYVWDVINPNQGKWRSGVRLMHHLLSIHKDDPVKRVQVMNSLARMYQLLLEDYARAAFWWKKAGADRDMQSPRGVNLAACYWKLGSKQMAVGLLGRLPNFFPSIKLWADMGETDRALMLAEAGARAGYAYLAYLYAGDACRVAGRHREALGYYGKVLAVPASGQAKDRIERYHQRARANIEAIKLFEMLDLSRVADGTYRASSAAYAGMLQVEVSVRGGRIESVRVTKHKEKQFYSAINDTPRQIVEKQGVQGVDAVTSATMTSEAIINATAKALAGGMK